MLRPLVSESRGDCLQQGAVGIKVAAGKNLHRESAARVMLPGHQFIPTHACIVDSSEDGDRAVERLILLETIALDHSDVGAQNREEDLFETLILVKLLRDSIVETSEFFHEFAVGKGVQQAGVVALRIGCTTTREKKPNGHRSACPPQPVHPLKCEERTHAVSEDCKGKIDPGTQFAIDAVYQQIEPGAERLGEPGFSSGKLDRAYLHKLRQPGGPGTIGRSAAARMRKTEEAHTQIARHWLDLKPGCSSIQAGGPPVSILPDARTTIYGRSDNVKRYEAPKPYWKKLQQFPSESFFSNSVYTFSPESLKERGQQNKYGDIGILAKNRCKRTFHAAMGRKAGRGFLAQLTRNGRAVDGSGRDYYPVFRINRYCL